MTHLLRRLSRRPIAHSPSPCSPVGQGSSIRNYRRTLGPLMDGSLRDQSAGV